MTVLTVRPNAYARGSFPHALLQLCRNSSAHDLRPLQIQFVIPGSSAHICGLLTRGDEIVSLQRGPAPAHTPSLASVRPRICSALAVAKRTKYMRC